MTDKICSSGHVYNQDKCDRCGGVEVAGVVQPSPVIETSNKVRVTKPKAEVKKVAKKVKGKK